MPKLDICIIELPHNLSAEGQSKIDTSRIRCKILKSNDEFPTSERHIRHQHHIASDRSEVWSCHGCMVLRVSILFCLFTCTYVRVYIRVSVCVLNDVIDHFLTYNVRCYCSVHLTLVFL